MHPRTRVAPELRRLALAQAGVVSRQQALQSGLSRTVITRLLHDRQIRPFDSGLYVLDGSEPTWEGLVWGGLLLGGDDARAAGLTAARLEGLTEDERLPIEIMVPATARVTPRDWANFTRERPGVRRPSPAREPKRLHVDDIVVDLCARGLPGEVITWATAAVQKRLTTPAALRATADRRSQLRNRALLNEILDDAAAGVHSHLEFRYVRDVERPHGLPEPVRQYRIPGTSRIADCAFPEYRVLLELDGRGFHSGAREFRDRRRDNRHSRAGWTTVRYGWTDIASDPCGVAWDLADVLIEHGWSGYPVRCGDCVEDQSW